MVNIRGREKLLRIGKVFSRVIAIAICIVVFPILILNLIFIVKGSLGPKTEVPSVFGFFPLIVQSGSMSGYADTGDLVIDKKVDVTKLKTGDVVSFWENEEGGVIVTHRISEIHELEDGTREFITKGDANNSVDINPVPESKVVGRVSTNIPKIGDLIMFMQTKTGIIIFIVVPIVLFYISEKLSRRQGIKNRCRI